MKQLLTRVSLLVMLASSVISSPTNAANGITLSTTEVTGTSGYTVVSWTSQTLATSTQVYLSIDQSATLTATATTLGSGSVTISGSGTGIVTLTVASSVNAGAVTYPVAISLPDGSSANYSIGMWNDLPTIDTGSALMYANGGNVVAIRAQVPATLAFALRNSADTDNKNTCELGVLSLTATSTCQYRLRVATNAADGFQVNVQADHGLGFAYSTMTNVTNDGDSHAGKEGYGFSKITGATAGGRNIGGTAYDQPVVEEGDFSVDVTPVPTSQSSFISYSASFDSAAAPSLSNTTLVEHAANIGVGTIAGAYNQTVTYSATASF